MPSTAVRSQVATQPTVALLYRRVSSKPQQNRGVSLPTQQDETRSYCANEGFIIAGEYTDVLSGKKAQRVAYQAMLSEVTRLAKSGRKVAVVTIMIDRLGRNKAEYFRAEEELQTLGAEIHATREGGLQEELIAGMRALVAADEIKRLGMRVSATKQFVKRKGFYAGGTPPLGYKLRPATKAERAMESPMSVLVRDRKTAPTVKAIFAKAAQGDSLRSIVNWMTTLPASARGGQRFAYPALGKLLDRVAYVGRMPFKQGDPAPTTAEGLAALPKAQWPALVTDDLFLQVQARLARHTVMPTQASGRFLLTGLLRCERCGSRMQGKAGKGGRRYRCQAGLKGGAGVVLCFADCSMGAVDQAVEQQVTMLLDGLEQSTDVLKQVEQQRATPTTDPAKERKAIERKADAARDRLRRAAGLLVDGALDRQGYDLLRAEIEAEIAQLGDQLAKLGSGASRADSGEFLRKIGGLAGAWRKADVAAKRGVLAELVSSITPIRTGRGKYDVAIQWAPELLPFVAALGIA